MESTLFSTLTASEEANLSGGWYKKHKSTPATPAIPAIQINLNNIIQLNIVVLSKDILASNTATAK